MRAGENQFLQRDIFMVLTWLEASIIAMVPTNPLCIIFLLIDDRQYFIDLTVLQNFWVTVRKHNNLDFLPYGKQVSFLGMNSELKASFKDLHSNYQSLDERFI